MLSHNKFANLIELKMNLIAPAFILLALYLDSFLCVKSSMRTVPAVLRGHIGKGELSDSSRTKCLGIKQNTTIVEVFTKSPNASFYPEYSSNRYNTIETLNKVRIFDPSKPTYLVIHGYLRGCLRDIRWARLLISALVRKENCNVLYADWKHKSAVWNYWEAFKDVASVAKELYTILELYEKAFKDFDKSKIHILAFSLGAQVAGNIGQLASGGIFQITAIGNIMVAAKSIRRYELISVSI